MGTIKSINVSARKGGAKSPVREGSLIAGQGLEGDAHAGPGPKQLSMLAWESILMMRSRGAEVMCGSFGENITTDGLDLARVRVGDRLRLGRRCLVEVTGIGKSCPAPCDIFRRVGYCIMPEEGVFCGVIEGGEIRVGDPIVIVPANERRIRGWRR